MRRKVFSYFFFCSAIVQIMPMMLMMTMNPIPPQNAIRQIHGNHQLLLWPPIQERNKNSPTKHQPMTTRLIGPPTMAAKVEGLYANGS